MRPFVWWNTRVSHPVECAWLFMAPTSCSTLIDTLHLAKLRVDIAEHAVPVRGAALERVSRRVRARDPRDARRARPCRVARQHVGWPLGVFGQHDDLEVATVKLRAGIAETAHLHQRDQGVYYCSGQELTTGR